MPPIDLMWEFFIMKKKRKNRSDVWCRTILLLSLLSYGLSVKAENGSDEQGGIGGTGYQDTHPEELRPDIPDRGIRPEVLDQPVRSDNFPRTDALDSVKSDTRPMPDVMGPTGQLE